MTRRRRVLSGLARVTGQSVVGAAIVGAHRAWQGWTRVRASLDPRHLGRRIDGIRRALSAEIQLASRG